MTKIDILRKEVGSFQDSNDIPYDTIKLPSKGLLYPEDHPFSCEEEVGFRPMGATQENILASRGLIKKGTVLPTLLKSSLINADLDPLTLLVGDRAAILLAIRISGFGSDYKIKTRCPSCGFEFSHTFNLSNVEYKFLEEEPAQLGKNLFEIQLPRCNKLVKFSLLTDGDDLEISQIAQQRKKRGHGDIDTRITDEIFFAIKSVEGNDDRSFIRKFVDKLLSEDLRAFRRYVKTISPGVDMTEEVTCSDCGEAEMHFIPIAAEFLWPEL